AEHQRWLARDDAEQLLRLSEPVAEGGLATPLDILSSCVALLCGDNFVEAGGQEVAPTVDHLATAALFVTEVWWDGHHRHTGYAAPAVPIVDQRSALDVSATLSAYDGKIDVRGQDGHLLWHANVRDQTISGYDLAPSGQKLAILYDA